MNKSRINLWIVMAAIITVATAALAFSQTGKGGSKPKAGGLGFELGMMTDYLELTDTQQGQVKQVLASAEPTLIPLKQQLGQTKQQILQEVGTGTFDQAKITALASQQSQTETQLNVEKARIIAEIFNILMPDQKAKAVTSMQKRLARFEQHLQNRQQKLSSQQ
jgi:Spy/CpxP family protein refolding chaperone